MVGILDKGSSALKGVLNQAEAVAPGLVSSTLAKMNLGELQGLVDQLQKGGLNEQVSSWLSSGANLPVNGEQIHAALGTEQVKQLAEKLGLPVDATLKILSEKLPETVDRASPDGKLQA
jgi:uncharacterized protein YidB (DUF937 family)